MNETCEAGTCTIVAFARSAMNRCSAGGIALSSVASKYQHGTVLHAGGEDGQRERFRRFGFALGELSRSALGAGNGRACNRRHVQLQNASCNHSHGHRQLRRTQTTRVRSLSPRCAPRPWRWCAGPTT
jgi:hypothetical protein